MRFSGPSHAPVRSKRSYVVHCLRTDARTAPPARQRSLPRALASRATDARQHLRPGETRRDAGGTDFCSDFTGSNPWRRLAPQIECHRIATIQFKNGGAFCRPPVCPNGKNLAAQRLSAANALTGKVSKLIPPGCATFHVHPPIAQIIPRYQEHRTRPAYARRP